MAARIGMKTDIMATKMSLKPDHEKVLAWLYIMEHEELMFKAEIMAFMIFDGDIPRTEVALTLLQSMGICQKQEQPSQ